MTNHRSTTHKATANAVISNVAKKAPAKTVVTAKTESEEVTLLNNHNKEALTHYRDGNIEMKQLLDIDDSYIEQLKQRTQFFLDGGHFERALIMLEMLEALDRTDHTVMMVTTDILLHLGRSDEAQKRVRALLKQDPSNLETQLAQVKVSIARGESAVALKIIADVVALDPQQQDEITHKALALAWELKSNMG